MIPVLLLIIIKIETIKYSENMSLTELIIFKTSHSKLLNIQLKNLSSLMFHQMFNTDSLYYDVESSCLDSSLLIFYLSQICLYRVCIHIYACVCER
jgi:hypothetical protein